MGLQKFDDTLNFNTVVRNITPDIHNPTLTSSVNLLHPIQLLFLNRPDKIEIGNTQIIYQLPKKGKIRLGSFNSFTPEKDNRLKII